MKSGLRNEPGERVRTPTRPYARKRGGPPSVTTIIDTLNKPGMSWAAAKETAEYAVLYRDRWTDLPDDKAIDTLYRWHRGIWDGRAAVGTLVHDVAERWSWGETVDVAELVDTYANREKTPVRSWQGRERLVAQDVLGYVNGLERFWLDFGIGVVSTEEVVRYTKTASHAYIGQRDMVFESPELSGRTLLDIKTTAQTDADKGLYFESWALQGAAYAHADEIVLYDDDGNETGTRPNYPVARFCVLHLRGDDSYELIEVPAGGDQHTRFLQLRGVWQWANREVKQLKTPVLNPVRVTEEVA